MSAQFFVSTRPLRFPFTFTQSDYDKVMITSATGNVETANLTTAQINSLGLHVQNTGAFGNVLELANVNVGGELTASSTITAPLFAGNVEATMVNASLGTATAPSYTFSGVNSGLYALMSELDPPPSLQITGGGPGYTAESYMGSSTSVSADGQYVVISVLQRGVHLVYVKSGTSWALQAELAANGWEAGMSQGPMLHPNAISGDGRYIALGHTSAWPGTTENPYLSGQVRVYVRTGTSWSLQATISPPVPMPYTFFGLSSLSISGPGDTLVIGERGQNTDADGANPLNGAGAAYFYNRTSTTWTLQQKVVQTIRTAYEGFGYSSSISSDETIAIIGSISNVYIFTKTNGVWSQTQKLVASIRYNEDGFGKCVSVSGDGLYIIAGTGNAVDAATAAAFIFSRPAGGSVWTEQSRVVSYDSNVDFGTSVAISRDGKYALVGASSTYRSTNAVYILTRDSSWTQRKIYGQGGVYLDTEYNDTYYETFGGHVSISGRGDVVAVGAPHPPTYTDFPGAAASSAYIFTVAQNVLGFSADGTQCATISSTGLSVAGTSSFQGHAIGRGGGNVATNFAAGNLALSSNTTGSSNVACGPYALQSNTTGTDNTAIGVRALGWNSTGARNAAFGQNAMLFSTTGSENTALGQGASAYNDVGQSNVGVGTNALLFNVGSSNVAVGQRSMGGEYQISNGTENTACGSFALGAFVTAKQNVSIGAQSMRCNTTGNLNTACGYLALSNTTSSENVGVGAYALQSNTTGTSNTACGTYALQSNTTGYKNAACGTNALRSNTTGFTNVAFGTSAIERNTTGGENSAIGFASLFNNTGGNQNTAIGYYASYYNTTGSFNTALGYNALMLTQASVTNTTFSNCTGLGNDARVSASNQVQLGNSTTGTYTYGVVNNRSDVRDKADIRDTVLGLEFIEKLRPVDYKWDMRDDYIVRTNLIDSIEVESPNVPIEVGSIEPGVYDILIGDDIVAHITYPSAIIELVDATHEYASETLDAACPALPEIKLKVKTRMAMKKLEKDGSKKRNRYHHGLIAQEVETVLQETGVDFGGFQHHAVGGGEDIYTIGYAELFGPLIKAVQELAAENATLSASNATLSASNATLVTDVESLKQMVTTMASDIDILKNA